MIQGLGDPIDEQSLQAIVRAEIEDAVNYLDLEISPIRIRETSYYRGQPFGDEVEGQSKVVSQDVRDTIQAILPSVLRIFWGSENVVEYVPRGSEHIAAAEQATDYIRYIVTEDNPGFLTFLETFKDALTNKTGIIKWWVDESREVIHEDFSGLDDMALLLLQQEPDIQIKVTGSSPDPTAPQPSPVGGADPGGTPQLHDVKITRTNVTKHFRIASLPPEEFLIDRRALTIEGADFVGHRSLKTVADLLEMGLTEEELNSAGTDSSLDTNLERLNRSTSSILSGNTSQNPMAQRLLYVEGFMKLDLKGDGSPTLQKICCIGDRYEIVHVDPAEERPFAAFCPDPEPHIFFGSAVSDSVMDIQRIKSQLMRLMLNSLSQAINPRTGVIEGQVNMDDVLNNENGGIIRMRSAGAVTPYTTPFVGQAAFPVLAYMDDVRESRTGTTKASQGLDADVLQSTTKAAVDATMQAAQQRIEMIARILAETGMKSLFKGLLRLVARHQDKARVIKLRGKWATVNPRDWDATMDVRTNVGLGAGTDSDRVNVLAAIAQKQELILSTLGPSNPIVTPAQYSNTLRKAAELSGFKDPQMFFSAVPPDWQPPQQQQQADPQQQAALILAQAQREQIQSEIQKKGAELQLKQQELQMTDARERYKIESDERVALAEIQAKYKMNTDSVQADIDKHNWNLMATGAQADQQRQHEAQQGELDRQNQAQIAAQQPQGVTQ